LGQGGGDRGMAEADRQQQPPPVGADLFDIGVEMGDGYPGLCPKVDALVGNAKSPGREKARTIAG